MGFTTEGLNQLCYCLVKDGAYLDLLDANGNTPSASLGYSPIPCYWENYPAGATDAQKENMAVFTAANGVLTNKYEFKSKEAFDPTYDYESGIEGPGWGVLTQLRIRHGSTEWYRGDLTDSNGTPTSVNVKQDWQVGFDEGVIQIAFIVTEVNA